MKFRGDIEGLRAVAVLPILLHHASVRGFHGGFIGVDIFFVISGYLITSILYRDIGWSRFSLAEFYRRRALRILPALFVMLLATMAIGFVALTPNEFVNLARSGLATTLFVSNIQFFASTGYFAASAANAPLLHTWSLAVEEQFYIFWPMILVAAARWGPRAVLPVVLAVSTVSLIAAVWMVFRHAEAAFYLLPFRAWELGLGGALAIVQSEPGNLGIRRASHAKIAGNALALAGIVTIAYCTHFYRQPIVFPGLTALPPTLGAVALIAAGPNTLVNRMLAIPIARFFGRISYSLYLWHWPIIVFASLWFFLPQSPTVIVGQIALSIAVATASYHLLEVGLRARLAKGPILKRSAVAIVACAALGLVVIGRDGFPGRFDPGAVELARVLDRDEEAAYRRGQCFVVEAGDRFDRAACLEAGGKRPSLLLAGDSVAAHYWPGLAAIPTSYDLMQATMVGCRPYLTSDPSTPCEVFFDDILGDWVPSHRPDVLMLSGNWVASDAAPLRATLAALRETGQMVVVVGPVPRYRSALPRLLFFSPTEDHDAFARSYLVADIWQIDADIGAVARETGATYVSPLRLLCDQAACVTSTAPGVPLQFDYVHLTHEGSEYLATLIMREIDLGLNASATAAEPLLSGSADGDALGGVEGPVRSR